MLNVDARYQNSQIKSRRHTGICGPPEYIRVRISAAQWGMQTKGCPKLLSYDDS